ncbi:sigma-70 family RNA polymerase sigma factor [Noviherbaspirillum humi]|uniref:sigma-70 family RNA polymerase sigma factor n=1 Tax=Noviherbaspirillum humi TaxID=1688639 RepID=UPI001FEB12E8|nr:sigma-70 family RNA polymerase sigma factor [Noviherbaspirillum humi]
MATTDPHQLQAWLHAIARQDRHAFAQLYAATAPKLFGYALRILSRREVAEEALQESFVNIWNSAAAYQAGMAAPMTWLTAIVRNKAFDLLRRADPALELDAGQGDDGMLTMIEAMESADAPSGEALQFSRDAVALSRCLQRLEGLHRQAIALAYFHDLSHSEVATRLMLPIGTVKTWIRRGLERLRLCLGGEAI